MIIGVQSAVVFLSTRQPNTLQTTLLANQVALPSPVTPTLATGNALAGGGNPGAPSSVAGVTDLTGLGASAQLWLMFLPVLTPFVASGSPQYTLAILDSTDFDDPVDTAYYSFRMEEVIPNRVPTVRRVILQYRDLGEATITALLTATNDKGQVLASTKTNDIGNALPTNTILTSFFDIEITGFRPQLAFTRNSGAGPLSIVSVTMVGEVEEVSL